MYSIELVVHDHGGLWIRDHGLTAERAVMLTRPARQATRACVVLRDEDPAANAPRCAVWWNGPHACVRIDDPHPWTASSTRPRQVGATDPIAFHGLLGFDFELPASATVSSAEADDALFCWLGAGARTPALRWRESHGEAG